MTLSVEWLGIALLLALGLLLVLAGRGLRRGRGLGAGRTVVLDRGTLPHPRGAGGRAAADPGQPRPGQCRPCGMREHCGQRRL